MSRQTISKWESAQSYPDFQRLVLLSEWYLIIAGTGAGVVLVILLSFILRAAFVW